MLPTNEHLELEGRWCSRRCPTCGVAECVTPSHHNWLCHCGHGRMQHLNQQGFWLPPGIYHPHPCALCPCDALEFLTVEQIVADLQAVEENTRTKLWDDSDTSNEGPI